MSAVDLSAPKVLACDLRTTSSAFGSLRASALVDGDIDDDDDGGGDPTPPQGEDDARRGDVVDRNDSAIFTTTCISAMKATNAKR
jgi:hypothetical protein